MQDKLQDKKSKESGTVGNPIVIKKYSNRRLYNTNTSSYVTLDNLNQMVRDNIEFVVCDAKTGEDITRSVLTQIILEEEGKDGQTLLPISFLRQLISFYGDQLNHLTLPHYLELSMRGFEDNQAQIRKVAEENFGNFFALPNFEDIGKQNLAMVSQAFRMFNPLTSDSQTMTTRDLPNPMLQMMEALKPAMAASVAGAESAKTTKDMENSTGNTSKSDPEIEDLKEKLRSMQQQLENISKPK